jgi:hypothetical protein
MEKELIDLKKKLYDLDDVEGDVWRYVNDWERKFWIFVGSKGSKYGWCEDEFENIQSLNEVKFPKDSHLGRIDCYKRLFEKIEKRG